MRLIDADAMKKHWNKQDVKCGEYTAFHFLESIDEQPTIEPKIVRCKDCKWFGDIGCAIEIVDDSDKPTENDFCSFAERREE